MRIFGKQTTGKACGCQTPSIKAATMNSNEEEAGIKILGSGCAKCAALEKAVRTGLRQELKLNWPIAHVTDWTEIAAYGVMSTPALVVKGKVVSYGKVLSVDEAKTLLKQSC